MKDTSHENIYLHIAERIMERIVKGMIGPGDKIPSVRETAAAMDVTPNTAAHAHSFLRELGITLPERGVGNMVTSEGPDRCRAYIRDKFISKELPLLKRRLRLLSLSNDELLELLEKTPFDQGGRF